MSLGGIHINANRNDDIVLNYTIPASDFAVAVSDGMGGHASGEIASYMTVRYLSDNYARVVDGEKTDLISLISEINGEVVREARSCPDYKGMGATLCGLLCRGGKLLDPFLCIFHHPYFPTQKCEKISLTISSVTARPSRAEIASIAASASAQHISRG